MIEHARLFEANATVTMRRAKLRPGKYPLPHGMSNGAAIEALMQGPKAKVVKTFKFTLPEGRSSGRTPRWSTKAPFDGLLREGGHERERAAARARAGLPRSSKNLEGFLFPATYEMIAGASARDLVERQLDAFRQNIAKVR